jgi:hypothetical protein
MFEGYSVSLPPPAETKRGNPEPCELLDEDIPAEPRSEVRRASSPPPLVSEPPSERQTLGYESVEDEVRKETPVALEAVAEAARAMQALEDRKETPSVVLAVGGGATPANVTRPTSPGIGAVRPDSTRAQGFHEVETLPLPPVVPAAEEPKPEPIEAPEGMRVLDVTVRLSGSLLKGRAAYVTLTLVSGQVLFEGDATGDAEGGARVDIRAVVPNAVAQVKALIEAGGLYRTATVDVAENGPTEYTFA